MIPAPSRQVTSALQVFPAEVPEILSRNKLSPTYPFQILDSGVVCYTAVDNENTLLFSSRWHLGEGGPTMT